MQNKRKMLIEEIKEYQKYLIFSTPIEDIIELYFIRQMDLTKLYNDINQVYCNRFFSILLVQKKVM